MVNAFMRLTAVVIVFKKLLGRPRQVTGSRPHALSADELDRIYGMSGDVMLDRMGSFDFAPGAIDEMMAAVDAAFEREPEGDD